MFALTNPTVMNLKVTLILFLFGWSGLAMAQYKNIVLDERVEGVTTMSAPAIVVNPRDPANIVAAVAPDLVYYTRDGGKRWQKDRIVSAFGTYGDPVLITGPRGNFYYVHTSGRTEGDGGGEPALDRMVIQRSDDAGASWSAGESLGLHPPKELNNGWATTDRRGSLFVTWRAFEQYGNADPECRSDLLFSMSKNGRKWTDPVVISKVAGNCRDDHTGQAGAIPVVTFDGKVLIAWSNAGTIYLDRSFNGGEMWLGNDIEVAKQAGGSNLAIPGHGFCSGMPVLLTDAGKSAFRGSLYLVWADQRNGADDTDIWFTRSHNFGDNWSSPTRINDDGKGKHQYMPWMAVDEATGYLYIVYFDRRNHEGVETDVYVAYSTDGGASFRNVLISETPFTPVANGHVGRLSNISASNGIIAPIWTRTDEGKSTLLTAIITHDALVKGGRTGGHQ